MRRKIAKSFNILYQSIVNDRKPQISDEEEFDFAREYISSNWKKLDLAVMEFLAIYMIKNPEGKIEFQESKIDILDLLCRDESFLRTLTFNGEGIIVKDEKRELAQKGD